MSTSERGQGRTEACDPAVVEIGAVHQGKRLGEERRRWTRTDSVLYSAMIAAALEAALGGMVCSR